MKKTKTISAATLALLALFAAGSCTKQILNPQDGKEQEATLTLQGSVSGALAGQDTKAGETVTSLQVLVFDELGYFVEKADAYGFTYSQGADGKETAFSVDLTATSEARRLHFLSGIDTGTVPFGSEAQIIGTMTTTGGATAFWGMRDLPDGISASSTASLQRIPLVRNTAAVTVVNNDDAFVLTGYKLTNLLADGAVAPWTPGTGPFTGYNTQTAPDYATLHNAGYTGTTPAGDGQTYDTGWVTGTTTVYERPYTGNAQTYTCLLVRGHVGNNPDAYYKLDLVRTGQNGANEYLDLLRNISYTVTLGQLSSSGYQTEAEALSHPAGNNISGSVDTEGLDNISDGRGQFFISDTEITAVTADPVTFRYRFVPDIINAPNTAANGRVSVEAPAGAVLSTSATVAGSDSNGWRTVTLRPNTPSGIVYTQTIRLTTDTGLTKTIRLTLRPKYNLTVSCTPTTVDQQAEESVRADITLPEGLPASFFPLKLEVSTDDGTLYPDPAHNALPVGYSDGAYHFVVEVLRSDYELSRTVQAWMLTNTTRSATTIRVRNKNFNEGSAAFTNSDRYVTSLTIRQRSFTVTNIVQQGSWFSSRRYYNNIYFYYSTNTATSNRINSTAFELYANGFQEDVTLTFNRQMKASDQIYMYNSDTSKGMLVTIEDLERGGLTITFS